MSSAVLFHFCRVNIQLNVYLTCFIGENYITIIIVIVLSPSPTSKYICSRAPQVGNHCSSGHFAECCQHDQCLKHMWKNSNTLGPHSLWCHERAPRSIKEFCCLLELFVWSSKCERPGQVSVVGSVCLLARSVWYLRTHTSMYPMKKLHSCLSLFSKDEGQASVFHGSGPTAAE